VTVEPRRAIGDARCEGRVDRRVWLMATPLVDPPLRLHARTIRVRRATVIHQYVMQ
jgi:hypothetical protein